MAISKARQEYLSLNTLYSYSLYDVNGKQTSETIEAYYISHPALSYSDYHGDMIMALQNYVAIKNDDPDYYEGCWLRNTAHGGQELLLPLALKYVDFTKTLLDALETYPVIADDTGCTDIEKQQEAWENYGFRDAVGGIDREIDKLLIDVDDIYSEDITDIFTSENCWNLQRYLSDTATGWQYTTYYFGNINGKNLSEVLVVLQQDIEDIFFAAEATYKEIIIHLTRYLIAGRLPVQLILPLDV